MKIHSSDIGFQDFMNLCKKCTAKPYSRLVIYTTLWSDNLIRFRKKSFRKNIKINHDTNDDKIRDEKLKYNINREAANISALSPDKIDKYEYLTGMEILPSNQSKIREQG